MSSENLLDKNRKEWLMSLAEKEAERTSAELEQIWQEEKRKLAEKCPYSNEKEREFFGYKEEEEEFQKLKNSAQLAQSLGLKVNAGHGLNYENVHRMHEIDGLHELNIGHSIISRAVFTGLDEAVKEMKSLIE